MALGPGKYDDLCTKAREEVEAEAVILMVYEGNRGSGFSVQAHGDILLDLPKILRTIAEDIERDLKIQCLKKED